MLKFLKIFVAGVGATLIGGPALAFGDPEIGAKIVASFECEQCHSVDGSPGPSGVPSLAGQKNGYLVRTLMHFKFGEIKDSRSSGTDDETFIQRKHPVMNDLTDTMTIKAIEDIAAFFSTRSCGPEAPEVVENITQPPGVETCEICHGGLRSNPWADTPYLAGQDKVYLIEQIQRLWNSKSGFDGSANRHHRLAEIMFRDENGPYLQEYAEYYSKLPCQH